MTYSHSNSGPSQTPSSISGLGTRVCSVRWLLLTCGLFCIVPLLAIAQVQNEHGTGSSDTDPIAIENNGAAIEIDGRPILNIYAQVGGFTPEQRAVAIEERILALARKKEIPIEAVHAEDRGTWTEIVAGPDRLMGITDGDARAAERTRPELAAEYVEILRQVVSQYRENHTWHRMLWAAIYTGVATLGLAGSLALLFFIRRHLRWSSQKWLGWAEAKFPSHATPLRLTRYFGRPLAVVSGAGFWIFVLVLVQAYGTLVLRFFPSTNYTSYQITNWIFFELAAFGRVILGYIPNLVLVSLLAFATYYLVKFNEYVFGEIRDGKLKIHGFYADWAPPTAKLVRVLILAGAVVVAFPYLPGSDSPAFKGVSVFLGILLSLGSSSAMAHALAGTILIYMRAFQVGDFVRIGNEVGEVVEKTLLVTRICTQKNEIVTVPNGTVLGGVVINYSGEARHKGVIFHTVVTIGYSAPWRQVHELLMSSALATDDIMHTPQPFVLQTALNDFYVAYELNAYTMKPKNMQNIYSLLHQNIQDKFNEAGVEINSPHYTSLRDGNQTTIPESYLPRDHKARPFGSDEIKSSGTPDRTMANTP